MLISQYFLPITKDVPRETKIKSHSLMIQAGMIKQTSSGIYNWLPLGLKILQKISSIVRENMDKAGFVEILMPCVQDAKFWRESGRFDAYGKEMLKFKDRHNNDLLFGPTNEDIITDIARNYFHSYRDLPKILYQIQWKFRDEIRPRFGVMRGREFLMQDAYSFDIDHASAIKSYNKVFVAYIKTFYALGLNVIPLLADSGEIGGDMSHEFHVITNTGESTIYYDQAVNKILDAFDLDVNNDIQVLDHIKQLKSLYAVTDEKHDTTTCPVNNEHLLVKKSIEVGQIFNFADKYSKSMNATVQNHEGNTVPLQMGSYGIGISRLVGAIIEVNHDDKGIIWPMPIAPFQVSIIDLSIKNPDNATLSRNLYDALINIGIEVLYDDTDARPGAKFATHDLIGSPIQIIIGIKNTAKNLVEIKIRESGAVKYLSPNEALSYITNICIK